MTQEVERIHIEIQGAVQGVGFRPFVYTLAHELGIAGCISNSPQGVVIEAEAPRQRLELFLERVERDKPPHSFIRHMETRTLPACGSSTFEIRASEHSGGRSAVVLPDLATCPDCLRELFDPANRRYRYPFTNCTHCGPRYSIITALPYDRPNTTMRRFALCADCRTEYENPRDRRFHAQPNACPRCGPRLTLWDCAGAVLAEGDSALRQAADSIRCGQIVALKGLGGFQLLCDARSAKAVTELRRRKARPDKPFALMYPTLEAVRADCAVSDLEARWLNSPEAPIVLLRCSPENTAALRGVAPGNPYLGVMLPYAPLHHLLMADLGFPIVATSGNLSGEPICTDEREALTRLGTVADLFLVHDRPIARHVDDSIVRVAAGREMVLRRARGFAPLPLDLPYSAPPLLATGAHLKNTIAITAGQQIIVSQHIGDLDTLPADAALRSTAASLSTLYTNQPEAIACDLHPDYRSTRLAEQSAAERGVPLLRVQHHYAHILACMAEHGLGADTGFAPTEHVTLGIAWDGTGYGPDGTIWGGEFLRIKAGSFERAAHLRPFRLPGGEAAIREPYRAALGVLYELFGAAMPDLFDTPSLSVIKTMLVRGINAPLTTSAGRLFDAAAALLGLCTCATFEGQAAMALEFAIDSPAWGEREKQENLGAGAGSYPFAIDGPIIDWGPAIRALLDERGSAPLPLIAARFHNTLIDMMMAAAERVDSKVVVLSGGCFQNRYLLEHAVARLRAAGFVVYWPRLIPPNDGGIAVGQIVAALCARKIEAEQGKERIACALPCPEKS